MPDMPEKVESPELDTMTRAEWKLLADRCYVNWDWWQLAMLRPEFADRCRWDNFSGGDWRTLLEARPRFASRCDFRNLAPRDFGRVFDGDKKEMWENHPKFR